MPRILSQTALRIKKGVGSASPVVVATDDFVLRVDDTFSSSSERNVDVLDDSFPVQELSGTLTGDQVWDASVEYRVTDDLRIPEGSSLTIQAGTRVLLGDRVNLRVDGQLRAEGSAEDPILFNSISRARTMGWRRDRWRTGRFRVHLLHERRSGFEQGLWPLQQSARAQGGRMRQHCI